MKGSILIVYHFFHPDDVVSARQKSGLAESLAKKNWHVSVLTSNRIYSRPEETVPKDEDWQGIHIHRAFRPKLAQSSNIGRLINSFWLQIAWLLYIWKQPAFDAIILGTDPQFSYFMLPFIRLLKRRSKLILWSFDVYPEAVVADSGGLVSFFANLVRPLTRFCYRRLDGMVDIGPCMRTLLDKYGHEAGRITLVPWALTEPEAPLQPDPKTRHDLFGDAELALLYSGTIGKAHEFECFVELARELRRRNASVAFCFAGRGNRYAQLREMVTEEDTNISFAGFADEAELAKRLSSGDIHMLSLRPGWEGIVVPSKFFGSLAAGKPLLYAGSPESSIRIWTERHDLGFVVEPQNIPQIADTLCHLAKHPDLLRDKQERSWKCYHEEFSRERVIEGWDQFLDKVLHGT